MWSAPSPIFPAISDAPTCDLFDVQLALAESKQKQLLPARSSPAFSDAPSSRHEIIPLKKAGRHGFVPARSSPSWSDGDRIVPDDRAVAPQTSSALSCRREPRRGQDENDVLKQELINDFLRQIDYEAAWRHGVVDLQQKELAEEMRQLSTRTLSAWSEAFLYLRSELMCSSYETYGLQTRNQSYETMRQLIKADPYFGMQQYIF